MDKFLNQRKNTTEKAPGLFQRLREKLTRGGSTLSGGIATLFLGKKEIDSATLEELEELLLSADTGVEATEILLNDLKDRLSRKEINDGAAIMAALRDKMVEILQLSEQPLQLAGQKPSVILMVGINGSGKTTTIGKLTRRFIDQGNQVMLAAGDTFRAAAIEQLQTWGERHNVPVIAHQPGADPAAVIFDALQAGKRQGVDIVLADTSGRLHTQQGLMDELKKIDRVIKKFDADAPHETLLVLDAGNGQNALRQAEEYHKAIGVSGIVLTKLDGTAKGGILFAIATQLGLPIKFIGVGESAEDLRPFQAREFVDALLSRETGTEEENHAVTQ